MKSILLIDDSAQVIEDLSRVIRNHLPAQEAEIRSWAPTNEKIEPIDRFKSLIDGDTILVVTDIDLTGRGQTGLFGASIVAWSQAEGLPVGDYSRDPKWAVPKEPNLFEMRVPKETELAGPYIAGVFRGFAQVRDRLAATPDLSHKRSPAAVIAGLLSKPELESQFALYGVRLGATSAALVERIVHNPADDNPTTEDRRLLLGYIVGHLLLNAVLRFPGPIVSAPQLCAYVGAKDSEAQRLAPIFSDAGYSGPFKELGPYYWVHLVDAILKPMVDALEAADRDTQTHGEMNRKALERSLGEQLTRHDCSRCDGVNGGFWCPFTKRAVCLRQDCSVGANSWVPQGARLCRIERVFYDDWSPILGI